MVCPRRSSLFAFEAHPSRGGQPALGWAARIPSARRGRNATRLADRDNRWKALRQPFDDSRRILTYGRQVEVRESLRARVGRDVFHNVSFAAAEAPMAFNQVLQRVARSSSASSVSRREICGYLCRCSKPNRPLHIVA